MKIGILTYHLGINHGAFLQAYCLQEYLKERYSDYEIEIINYQPKLIDMAELEAFLLFRPYRKKVIIRLKNLLKIIKFRIAQHKHLYLTKRVSVISDIDTSIYDIVILGSDEIWNVNHTKYTNPTYFGDGINAKKIVSYAPSFGSTSINNLSTKTIDLLSKINSISVRDDNSMEIVEQLRLNVTKVVDPTFLYTINQPLASIKKVNRPYILIYMNSSSKSNIDKIKEFATKKKILIVGIAYPYSWVDRNIININPFEWVSFFKHASYIITNTFHGAVYSIISEKKFIALEVSEKTNKINSLLGSFNILHLKIDTFNSNAFSEIDYLSLNKRLKKNILTSESYLEKQIIETK